MREGASYAFRTAHIDAKGVVLSIDHAAEFPIKIEWTNVVGDKRHTVFCPDEFINLKEIQ